MLENFVTVPGTLERLRSGVLGEHVEGFCAALLALGYAHVTIHRRLMVVARLARWMDAQGVSVASLDTERVAAFTCAEQAGGTAGTACRQTLPMLLEHLGAPGRAGVTTPPEGSVASRLWFRYERYLREERGLAPATIGHHRLFVLPFMAEFALHDPSRCQALCSLDVRDFVLARLPGMKPNRMQALAAALRSFLRFLFVQGELDGDLTAAIPSVRRWRLAGTPGYLDPDEVNRLLDACEASTPRGRRDHVILLLLARLGLRAGEVVRMELDDLRWREGELVVRSKGGLCDRLPLPHEVGAALAQYLQHDRPACASRRVFIRCLAPYRGLAPSSTVSVIVRQALERASLRPAKLGGHLLRHSLASQLLRDGASLTEIGQLLRHRSPKSTETYAKLDFTNLHDVAAPWPLTPGATP